MNILKQTEQEHAEHTEGGNSVTSVTSCKNPVPVPNSAPPRLSGEKPRKIVVPLAVGLAWGNDPDYIVQEKLDGRYQEILVESSDFLARLAGELMPTGKFHAFDLLEYGTMNLRSEPLRQRLSMLDSILTPSFYLLNPNIRRVQSATDGGTFLAEVLARGGEGIVRKRLDSPWGTVMEACKRLETFTCIVTGLNAGQSVQIARIINGRDDFRPSDPAGIEEEHFYQSLETQPCGSVKLGGGKADRVRVGSILKIEGFGLTREGKIREPRPCADSNTSFLIQY